MRKLILPFLAIFLIAGFTSFSQGTDCATANYIEINHDVPVASRLTCGNFALSSLVNQGPVGPCTGAATGRATWFFFLTDAVGTCPMLSIDGPTATKVEVALYSDCATLVAGQGVCLNNGSGAWSPTAALAPSTIYYLRIWTAATTGNIGICDVPTVAQDVVLDGTCTSIDLSPTTSIISGNISSAATCTGTAGKSVIWAKFHTTAVNNCVTINVNDKSGIQAEMVLYGNGTSCNNGIRTGSSVCYNDGIGVWSAGPSFPANLYTPNKDYYLRLYTNTAAGPNEFISLCGTEKTQAINDLCSTAIGFKTTPPLPANNACAHYTSATEGITNANANYLCATTLQNTVWYKFKVTTGGIRAAVTISSIDCDSYDNNSTLLQMGLLTGNCGSLLPAITPARTSPFPVNNTPAAPTSCLATNIAVGGATQFTLYTSTAVTANQVVYLGIDGFSGANCKFNLQSIANITPIPIILKYFTAWKLPGKNLIRWVTASEHNNNYFEVERSLDGTNFNSIGRVDGQGNAITDQVYDLNDNDPPALAYYRLKQVDIDEKFSYSEVIMLKRSDNIFFNATMANPASNNARVSISTDDAGMVALRIMDGAGRQLMSDNVACTRGTTIVNKDLSRLPAGNYFLVLTQDSKRIVKPFVKQ